ncbi:MAG: hypothetical protein Q8R32_02120 [bacterium]|nr:hypothetical protein [bacterium]
MLITPMKRSGLATSAYLLFCAGIFVLGLRGISGNPTSAELNTTRWKEDGPLELSPERGRFALLYSIVEDRSFQFSVPLARFTTPDVGYAKGKYVSLFPPGVSFLVLPGYLLGKFLGASQVGAFAMIAVFALLNILLLRAIALRLGAHPLAANVGALAFAFASPAFAYAVSLYQHHLSTFLILLSITALLRWNTLWSASLIWFLWGVSVLVDSPNLVLMLPVGLVALGRIIFVRRTPTALRLNLNVAGVGTFLTALLPLVLFLWFNQGSYGNPLQLAGTVQSVEEIDAAGQPTESQVTKALGLAQKKDPNTRKTALGFFNTRNMLTGLYLHGASLDRGILWYAPVILFGIPGLALLSRTEVAGRNLLLSLIGMNVLLYSMWGDPAGGWAFGSRYLIPSYALLAVGIAIALTHWRRRTLLLAVFFLVFSYSTWVNTLGAVTSNANPPRVEVLGLETLSGKEEKYTFERNLDSLRANRAKSFVFQTVAKGAMSASVYHVLITATLLGVAFTMLILLSATKESAHPQTKKT